MSINMATQQEAPGPRVPRDTFAARLVLLRHELELTVEQISDRCGIASATWSTWEHGTSPRDKAEVCKKIAEGTDYDREWLTFGELPLRAKWELLDGGLQDAQQPSLPFRADLNSVS